MACVAAIVTLFQSTHPHGVRPATGQNPPALDSVSIHAPTRGATQSHGRTNTRGRGFNPRTHTGCDAPCSTPRAWASGFNPRTHTGCDRFVLLKLSKNFSFQSTHPHGVRPLLCLSMIDSAMFQSTHPHGVRRSEKMAAQQNQWFQSTHPHGVRQCDVVTSQKRFLFQSTHPHGVRLIRQFNIIGRRWSFNPRTHTGCDLLCCCSVTIFLFQSTHPHGVRLAQGIKDQNDLVFQSTHPHGVRQLCLLCRLYYYKVSIHAPTRGATRHIYLKRCGVVFQSTHPHGVRQLPANLITECFKFQSTHPHGVRLRYEMKSIKF